MDTCSLNKTTVAPSVLAQSPQIPGYRFIKKLGQGTQGKVFLAERLTDGLQVAIKQLTIESVKNWKSYDLFHREADILKSLDINGIAKREDAMLVF